MAVLKYKLDFLWHFLEVKFNFRLMDFASTLTQILWNGIEFSIVWQMQRILKKNNGKYGILNPNFRRYGSRKTAIRHEPLVT